MYTSTQKRQKIGFQDPLSLNAGQKYSAILLTFIKLPFVIKTFFFLFLSGRFTQVLLYIKDDFISFIHKKQPNL